MLTQPQAQRYARESGLRDIMIAEREIVLTYLLQLLSERGAFQDSFHGIQFSIPDGSYYESDDRVSWGVNPAYVHDWNSSGESEIKFQVSRRETPTLPTERRSQIEQSYFACLPFQPTDINCLALEEFLAEKIRACCQRDKARDVYDLAIFAARPLNQALIRRLVVIKLWQVRDKFDPGAFTTKLRDGSAFDWDGLTELTRHGHPPNRQTMIADCINGYAFLAGMTEDERTLANDPYQRRPDLHAALTASAPNIIRSS